MKRYKIFTMLVMTLTMVASPFIAVYTADAMSAKQLDIFNKGINYFDVNCDSSSGNDDFTIKDNKDYEGNPIWTDAQLAKVKELKHFYESAAKKYNIPWQMLAVEHVLESGQMKGGPSNGQGPYQQYTGHWPVGPYDDAQFQSATDKAAEMTASAAGGADLNQADNVKRAFYHYNSGNGSAVYEKQAKSLGFSDAQAANGEGSPYVMNRADAKRDSRKNPNWVQYTCDNDCVKSATQVYGAYVYYAALVGSDGSSSSSSSSSSSDNSSDKSDSSSGGSSNDKYVWVGDSRTEDMSQVVKDGKNTWITKVGSGYDWFNSEAAAQTTSKVDGDSNIVFNFGVNDLSDADKYISKLNDLAKGDWNKAKKIIIMSVNPVDEKKAESNGYSVKNSDIEAFNKKLQAGVKGDKIEYVDTYSKLKGKVNTTDGLHYDFATYKKIYDMIVKDSGSDGGDDECTSDSSGGGEGNGDIVKTAISLAWPDNSHHSEIKPEYQKALTATGGNTTLSYAQDCGHFVATVMKYSGADKDFPAGGTGNMQKYMETSGKYESIENKQNTSNLQPGDIFVVNAGDGAGANGHIFIYIGDQGDGNDAASASYLERTGNLSKTIFHDSRGNYKIFRLKK